MFRGVRSNAVEPTRLAKSHASSIPDLKANIVNKALPLLQKYNLSYKWVSDTKLVFGSKSEVAEGDLTLSSTMVGVQYTLNKYGFLSNVIYNKVDSTMSELVASQTNGRSEVTKVSPQNHNNRGVGLAAGLIVAALLMRD